MSILAQYGSAPIHADAPLLEQRLYEMDPRLQLKYVTRKHPRRDTIGRRYEVHRHNEDGSETMIGHWRLEEFDKIESDLRIMAAGAAGRVPSAIEEIDRHNAGIERQRSDEFRDSYGAMLDHATRLVAEREHGKQTFYQVGGSRDA